MLVSSTDVKLTTSLASESHIIMNEIEFHLLYTIVIISDILVHRIH